MSRRGLAAAVAGAVIALDIVSKVAVVARLENEGRAIDLIGEFVRFRVTRNPGAAFSLFQDGGMVLGIIAALTIIVIAAVVTSMERTLDVIGLALVAGGAAGNLVDRIWRGDGFLDGRVIDFIDIGTFPSFNVADSAITVGAAIVILSAFVADRSSR